MQIAIDNDNDNNKLNQEEIKLYNNFIYSIKLKLQENSILNV
ncbi:MAG: hypothetical protein K0S93_1424 [Nitrososphaeraceae archaeon]|jgi:hypothetical protein|nr:hypothetical protein [Nitrososphaeraceae archaeon]